jgi:DtxR family Mn-dependent transcriptional regulator
LLRIKRNLCRGEGYFIRVLEVLRQTEIALGSEIEIIERSFDSSFRIRVGIKEITVSNKIASNLYIK